MKKLAFVLLFIGFLLSNTAYAGLCKVPGFLKIGSTYKMTDSAMLFMGTILEIDKDNSCWIKVRWKEMRYNNLTGKEGVRWINLTLIHRIE